ncbi:MAG: lactate utilization protein [Clostridia bacterium]|nr:lactate utilization protein [Clostridia bacterium]
MNTQEARKKYYRNAAETVIKNLEKRHMKGYYAENAEEAKKLALSLMPEGSSVAWGGSMTCTDIGLIDAVKTGNYDVIDRMEAGRDRKSEAYKNIYGRITTCDFFLMGTNAITLDGELVNVDGTGNRVAFLCFGPENVIVVAGMNKLVKTREEAIDRARNVAAPINTVRLERRTPCTVTGKCEDCCSPDCICDQIVVTRLSKDGRIKVILVGEELGF